MEEFSDIKCFLDWGPYAVSDEHIWENCAPKFKVKCRVCKVSLNTYDFTNHQPCKTTFITPKDIANNSKKKKFKQTSENNIINSGSADKNNNNGCTINNVVDGKENESDKVIDRHQNKQINSIEPSVAGDKESGDKKVRGKEKRKCDVQADANEKTSEFKLRHNFYRYECLIASCDFCKLPFISSKRPNSLKHSGSSISLNSSPSQLQKKYNPSQLQKDYSINFPNSPKCSCLQCIACKKIIHDNDTCLEGINKTDPTCDYGILSRYVIFPQWIVKTSSANSATTVYDPEDVETTFSMKQSFCLRPPETFPQNYRPILVFINIASGSKAGSAFYNNFLSYLNPRQIFLLPLSDPLEVLDFYKDIPKLTIIICAGDGSMSWIASSILKKRLENQVQISCIPLGTGNDLSNQLNWGNSISNEKDFNIFNLIKRINSSVNIQLDTWSVRINRFTNIGKPDTHIEDVVLRNNIFCNYCSFGADARIAYYFNKSRTVSPQNGASRFDNFLSYVLHSIGYLIKQPYSYIFKRLELYCDDKDFTKVLRSHNIQILLLLNIRYYAAGMEPWVSSLNFETDKFGSQFFTQDIADGYIEVVGISMLSFLKMTAVNQGAYKIAQCKKVRIVNNQRLHMQMDGEPYIIEPGESIIEHAGKINACYNSYQNMKSHKYSDSFSLKMVPSLPNQNSVLPTKDVDINKRNQDKIVQKRDGDRNFGKEQPIITRNAASRNLLKNNPDRGLQKESEINAQPETAENDEPKEKPRLVHRSHRRSISFSLFENQLPDGTKTISESFPKHIITNNSILKTSDPNKLKLNGSIVSPPRHNGKKQAGATKNSNERNWPNPDELLMKFWITSVPLNKRINEAITKNKFQEVLNIINENPGIDYNKPDSNGDTCLHYAIKTNNTFLISLLLINGADPYIKNRDGLNSFKLLKNNRDWQQNYSILKQLSK